MPVSVTAMSLLRTGIDQMLNRFRLVSQAALQAVGAAVYDRTGLLIMAGTRTAGAPGPEPSRLVGTAPGDRT